MEVEWGSRRRLRFSSTPNLIIFVVSSNQVFGRRALAFSWVEISSGGCWGRSSLRKVSNFSTKKLDKGWGCMASEDSRGTVISAASAYTAANVGDEAEINYYCTLVLEGVLANTRLYVLDIVTQGVYRKCYFCSRIYSILSLFYAGTTPASLPWLVATNDVILPHMLICHFCNGRDSIEYCLKTRTSKARYSTISDSELIALAGNYRVSD